MPELPEVHALAADLRGRLGGETIDRLELVSFAALKTFDPPVSALEGGEILDVTRHGKFLDLVIRDTERQSLHLVMHLARAGWLRWRAAAPGPRTRPGAGPLAARLVMRGDGHGIDATEAGSKKGLAIWLVRDVQDVPGIARLGPDPLAEEFDEPAFQRILADAGRSQIKGVLRSQSRIAGIGNATPTRSSTRPGCRRSRPPTWPPTGSRRCIRLSSRPCAMPSGAPKVIPHPT